MNFQSPIQLAIRNDKAKCAKILIKMGANLINVNNHQIIPRNNS